MKHAAGTTVIANGQLIDGIGAAPIPNGSARTASHRMKW